MQSNICTVCFFNVNSCICQSFWKDFQSDLESKDTYDNINPSDLSISTMTYGMKLDKVIIDLDRLKKLFKKDLFFRDLTFRKGSKKSKKDESLNYQFYNQCSITSFIPDQLNENKVVKVSTKIFHNGSFNFTGLKNVQSIVHMVRTMLIYLTSLDGVIKHTGKIKIINSSIKMINTDYKLGMRVRQKLLNETLQDYSKHIKESSFDPDKYNGVKISFICDPYSKSNTKFTRKGVEKVKGEITMSVFNTGNIIITGGNTMYETMYAYKWINQFFDDNIEQILRPFPKDYKPKKKNSRIYFKDDILKEITSEIKKDLFDCHKKLFSNVLEEIKID